jgi:hypothetical protein
MQTRVCAEVVATTRSKQVPWSNSSLLGGLSRGEVRAADGRVVLRPYGGERRRTSSARTGHLAHFAVFELTGSSKAYKNGGY